MHTHMPLHCIEMDEEEFVSLADTVTMVSNKYANLQEMIDAHENATDPVGRALLEVSILVHIYLKIGKPEVMKDKINDIWDGLCSHEP